MSRTMTGAKAIFRLAEQKVAFASQVSYTEEIALSDINVMDKLEVEEYAETGYRVSLQCQTFRVAGLSPKQLGIMSKLPDILTQGDLTAEIIERTTGTTILLMEGVKMESRQSSMDARGVATETWNFRGIKSSDEA